jgi:hypothetical protein
MHPLIEALLTHCFGFCDGFLTLQLGSRSDHP